MTNAAFKKDFQGRSQALAKRTLLFVDSLPSKPGARIIANQLGRSATSVPANYRAACRARSTAEFIAKLGIVEEEADEFLMWLELARECGYATSEATESLSSEMNELLPITVACIKSTRANQNPDSKNSMSPSRFQIDNSNMGNPNSGLQTQNSNMGSLNSGLQTQNS
ncbi:MAG TPA: four helix bundle protein [Fimbriimonadaceae bacterium]|nr:four helix bundle protein [Fimbriimonadaceae bacterium]